MRVNILFVTAVTAALLVQTANAMAADPVFRFDHKNITEFQDKNNHILALGPVTVTGIPTVKDGSNIAFVMIENGKDDNDRKFAHFYDRAAWGRFVSFWNKARVTPPPNRGWVDIGEFTDPSGSILSVVKYASHTVGFEVDDPDGVDHRVFKLDPSDFAAFNSKVLEISKTLPR